MILDATLRLYYTELSIKINVWLMTDIVSNEVLLKHIQDIQWDLDELKAASAWASSEMRTMNKETVLFFQSRRADEQSDLRE